MNEVQLQQCVIRVVPRIALVAAEVHRAVDAPGEIGIELNQALRIALVPVVAGPGFVGDVLHRVRLTFGKLDELECAASALLGRRFENFREFVGRDLELAAKRVDTDRQLVVARKQCVDFGEYGVEMCSVIVRCTYAEQSFRFLVKRARLSAGKIDAGIERAQPREQALDTHDIPIRIRQLRCQRLRSCANFLEARICGLGRGLDSFGTEIRVDMRGVVKGHAQFEEQILLDKLVNAGNHVFAGLRVTAGQNK